MRAGAAGAVAGQHLPTVPVPRYEALDSPSETTPQTERTAAGDGGRRHSPPPSSTATAVVWAAAAAGSTAASAVGTNKTTNTTTSNTGARAGGRRRLPAFPTDSERRASPSPPPPLATANNAAGPFHLEDTVVQAASIPQAAHPRSRSFVSGGASSASGNSLVSALTAASFTSTRVEEESALSPLQHRRQPNTSLTPNANAGDVANAVAPSLARVALPSPPHADSAYTAAVAAAVHATYSSSGGVGAAVADDDGAGPAVEGYGDEFVLVDETDADDDDDAASESNGESGGFLSRWGKGNATKALKQEQRRRKKLMEKARKEQLQQQAKLAVLEEQAAVEQRRAAATAESISQFQNDGSLVCVGGNFEVVPEVLAKAYGDTVARLDLSFNRLTSLDGIEKFEILEELVLDNNCLDHTMKLDALTDLSALSVNNNQISDLHAFVRSLTEHCPNLKFLSMVKNKACPHFTAALESSGEYELYRHYIIFALRQLKFLDSRAVTLQERVDASQRFRNANKPFIRPIKECIQEILKPWSKDGDADPDNEIDGEAAEEKDPCGLEVTVSPSPTRTGMSFVQLMTSLHSSSLAAPVQHDVGTEQNAAVVEPKTKAPSLPAVRATEAAPTAAAAYKQAKTAAKKTPTLSTIFAPKAKPGSTTPSSGFSSLWKGSAQNTGGLATGNETIISGSKGVSLKAMFGIEKTMSATHSGSNPVSKRRPLSQNTRVDTVL